MRLAALVVLAFVTMTTPVTAQQILRCTPVSGVSMADDGSIHPMRSGTVFFSPLLIDLATGAVRLGGSSTVQQYRVAQRGDGANDWVLVPNSVPARPEFDLRNAASDFIRVRAWSDLPKVTFLHFLLSSLITGTCEPLR